MNISVMPRYNMVILQAPFCPALCDWRFNETFTRRASIISLTQQRRLSYPEIVGVNMPMLR